MAKGGKEILRRIKSVGNTKKITKAMKMVAQAKMKKAQDKAHATKAYAEKAYQILLNLSMTGEFKTHPLFTAKAHDKTLYIVISSNKGLCGGLNTNVLKELEKHAKNKSSQEKYFIPVGRKGEEYILRMKYNLDTKFPFDTDATTYKDIKPLTKHIFKQFEQGNANEVFLVYTKFINTLVQKAEVIKLLPFDEEFMRLGEEKISNIQYPISNKGQEMKVSTKYKFEPHEDILIVPLIHHIVEAQILQACYESSASEHSARMMAMQNATDNAGELMDELTLIYNKARQATITQEISEIVAGAGAQG
jgi:F-type H+-transporting ATPase subunit gamma